MAQEALAFTLTKSAYGRSASQPEAHNVRYTSAHQLFVAMQYSSRLCFRQTYSFPFVAGSDSENVCSRALLCISRIQYASVTGVRHNEQQQNHFAGKHLTVYSGWKGCGVSSANCRILQLFSRIKLSFLPTRAQLRGVFSAKWSCCKYSVN